MYLYTNFKIIGSKPRSWQCYCFFDQYGGRDVIIMLMSQIYTSNPKSKGDDKWIMECFIMITWIFFLPKKYIYIFFLILLKFDRYFNDRFLVKCTKYAYILDQRVDINRKRRFVFGIASLSVLTFFFRPSFYPEVDIDSWITIPNLEKRKSTCIPNNFKEDRIKTVAVTMLPFFRSNGDRDVINYTNEPKHNRKHLDI